MEESTLLLKLVICEGSLILTGRAGYFLEIGAKMGRVFRGVRGGL